MYRHVWSSRFIPLSYYIFKLTLPSLSMICLWGIAFVFSFTVFRSLWLHFAVFWYSFPLTMKTVLSGQCKWVLGTVHVSPHSTFLPRHYHSICWIPTLCSSGVIYRYFLTFLLFSFFKSAIYQVSAVKSIKTICVAFFGHSPYFLFYFSYVKW